MYVAALRQPVPDGWYEAHGRRWSGRSCEDVLDITQAFGYIGSMPTVHREAGFQFRIYPNDHAPAHVHAWKVGAVVVILLEALIVREVKGKISDREIIRAVRIAERQQTRLMEEWRKIHD